MIKDGRWRGRMPFRQNRKLLWPEPIDHRGRTGEPSLANFINILDFANEIRRQGHSKSEGSFTEHVRQELHDWLAKNGLNWHSQISFRYRLYRRKVVVVTITYPRIYHRKLRGNGSKGFTLEGRILSIDGMPPAYGKVGEFALNRIVGHHPLRMLVAARNID